MIEIYTDGACTGNGSENARGAWAFVAVVCGQLACNRVGVLGPEHKPHTNNKAELMAAKLAMDWMSERIEAGEPPHPFKIVSDSRYLVDGMNKWTQSWRKRGWRGKKRPEIKNLEIWQALRAQADKLPVVFAWVRGHNGNRWNERADELAEDAAANFPLDLDFNTAKVPAS